MSLLDRLAREPVLAGAAGLATVEAVWPDMSPAGKLAVGAWVAYLQRTFSTSKKTSEENVESAKYVGAVEHQAVAVAGSALAAPSRPLRAPARPMEAAPPGQPPSV